MTEMSGRGTERCSLLRDFEVEQLERQVNDLMRHGRDILGLNKEQTILHWLNGIAIQRAELDVKERAFLAKRLKKGWV
jgi:hypothetical protein